MECSNKFCEVLTETVAPIAGIFTSYFIFVSPFKDIQRLRKSTDVCTINPIPSVMIFCNCLCWNLYSYVTANHWTFWPNVGGILFGEYYIMVLASSRLRSKDFIMSTITLLIGTLLNIAGAAISFIIFDDDKDAAKTTMGIVCIIILCAMYVSPLTTLFQVIKTRNSSSLNVTMTIASFSNGFLWVLYGIFYNDFYIWFPNGLGVLSSILQMFFICIFPKTHGGVSAIHSSSINIKKDKFEPLPSPNSGSTNTTTNSDPNIPSSRTPIRGNSQILYV